MKKFLVVLVMSMFAAGPGFAQTGGAAEGAGAPVISNTAVAAALFFTLVTVLVVGAISSDGESSTVSH